MQFDPVRDVLTNRWDLGVPCAPNGMAINPSNGMALIACGGTTAQHILVWDLRGARLAGDFPQAGAGDVAIYDPRSDRFLVGLGSFYRGGQIAVFGGTPVRFLTNIPTARGTSDVAFDTTNRVVYTKDPAPNSGGLLSFDLPGVLRLPATGGGPDALGVGAVRGLWLVVAGGLAALGLVVFGPAARRGSGSTRSGPRAAG